MIYVISRIVLTRFTIYVIYITVSNNLLSPYFSKLGVLRKSMEVDIRISRFILPLTSTETTLKHTDWHDVQ